MNAKSLIKKSRAEWRVAVISHEDPVNIDVLYAALGNESHGSTCHSTENSSSNSDMEINQQKRAVPDCKALQESDKA